MNEKNAAIELNCKNLIPAKRRKFWFLSSGIFEPTGRFDKLIWNDNFGFF
jgi:hypothetical protein